MKVAKILVIVLGVIIIILLAVLFFYNPVKAPTLSSDGHLAIISPQENALVSSPITMSGTVTGGGWFFEASFPVKVLDGDGTVIGSGIAQAQTDWTSTS